MSSPGAGARLAEAGSLGAASGSGSANRRLPGRRRNLARPSSPRPRAPRGARGRRRRDRGVGRFRLALSAAASGDFPPSSPRPRSSSTRPSTGMRRLRARRGQRGTHSASRARRARSWRFGRTRARREACSSSSTRCASPTRSERLPRLPRSLLRRPRQAPHLPAQQRLSGRRGSERVEPRRGSHSFPGWGRRAEDGWTTTTALNAQGPARSGARRGGRGRAVVG